MRPRVRFGVFVAAGLAIAALVALFVAPEASSQPDGLERVAIDEGFAEGATDHDLADSPVADYGVEGVDDARLSTGLAGLAGIVVTFVVVTGLLLVLRRSRRTGEPGDGSPAAGVPSS